MSYNWSNPVDFGSGFGADTQGQFKDITSFLPTKQGGNMLLAPLAANAIGPLISAGASMFGANKADQAAKRSEKLARENAFGINFQSFLGRQAADAANTNQLAFAIGDRNFSNTLSDLDLNRQKDAELFKVGPLASKDAANRRDFSRAFSGMENSLENKEFAQRQNRQKLIDSVVRDNARMAGAFGQIAPINVSTMAVG
jgi:hypothetical protein